jgi:uncharacterized OsmC-like protein
VSAIRTAIETASGYLAENPDAGRGIDTPVTAVIEEGLRVRVEGKQGTVVTDMAKGVGGGASAPSPGYMLRVALAACDASMLAMEAARDGIELTHLEVRVESNSDSRGLLGMDDAMPPGPLEVRVHIELAADGATPEQLRAIADRAEARSPVRDAIAREVPVTTEIVTRA